MAGINMAGSWAIQPLIQPQPKLLVATLAIQFSDFSSIVAEVPSPDDATIEVVHHPPHPSAVSDPYSIIPMWTMDPMQVIFRMKLGSQGVNITRTPGG